MKKLSLICALLGIILLSGCIIPTTDTNDTKEYSCKKGYEYFENRYDNGNLESQGCLKEDSDIMEGHLIYYFKNGGKDMEGDIINDLAQGTWTFYDENGNNIVVMKGNYENGLEEGEWKYYDDEGKYMCSDIFKNGELTNEGDCYYTYGYNYNEYLNEQAQE